MSRTTKIVLGVVGGLLSLCCLAVVAFVVIVPRVAENFVENNVTDDTEKAAEVGQSIVDYDLPDGLHEEGAMSLVGIRTVFMTSDVSDQTAVILMEFPAYVTGGEEEMRRQMEQAFANQSGQQNLNMKEISTEEVVINDEKTILTTMEGKDGNGTAVRQITGIFEANSGNSAMLMIVSPIDSWEESNLDKFIDSLH